MRAPDAAPVSGQQLQLLTQMIEEISGELALEPLLGRLVERACHLIGADDGLIGLYVPEDDVIRTAASHNIPPHELVTQMARGHGLSGQVLAMDAPYRGYYAQLAQLPAHAPPDMFVIGMPIRAQGRFIGVFGVGVHGGRTLDVQAQDLLEVFARHAGMAITNARRYAEEKRRSARFALIARVAAIGASGPDLDSLLQQAADAIHETLDYPNVDIPLVDPEQPDTLVIRIRGGDYKRLIRHEDRMPVGRGIMGAAVRERRIQLVNDVARDARYVTPPGVQPPQAELAIPILHGQQVLGVLNVEGDVRFDDLDCASLEIVAEHLGIAIVNARLFEQSREVAILEERQRLARELHDSVTQILSSMSLITQSLTPAWQQDPAEGARRVERLGELSRLAFGEMRGLLHELAPSAQARPRLHDCLQSRLVPLLAAMVPDQVKLVVRADGLSPQLGTHEDAVVRICQEAVSNAVRHGQPSTIAIRVRLSDEHLLLTILDDGCGMPAAPTRGMGLDNMRDRLAELGGSLRFSPRVPKGTRIRARLPRMDRDT